MTVIAHQKQIEELRESFRQKVSEAECWPEKVTDQFYYGRQCGMIFFLYWDILVYLY